MKMRASSFLTLVVDLFFLAILRMKFNFSAFFFNEQVCRDSFINGFIELSSRRSLREYIECNPVELLPFG